MIFICLIFFTYLTAQIDALKPIHLTIVVCGDRLEEALTALKSSLIFTPPPIIFHIFTEDHLRDEFNRKIDSDWSIEYKSKFEIEFYSIEYTRGNDQRWRELFKPCCTQRLFLPDILKTLDSVIYIDTDILFLTNVRHLWRFFRKFNSTQLAALSAEHEDPAMGWYNRFARHPYYGSMGLNSGVMLMNLTRMREVKMISKIIDIFDEYHMNITWGDQCLLNIYFHFYPEQLYEFGCEWNYRPDHCIYENNCQKARHEGIKILHGCRRAFHNDKYLEFRSIYERISQWKFDSNLKTSLLKPIQTSFEQYSSTNCGKSADIFTKYLSKQISSLDYIHRKTSSFFHIAFIFNHNYQSIEQTLILFKSFQLFSSSKNLQYIHLHIIISDNHIREYLSQQIETMTYLRTFYNTTITHPLELYNILNVDRVIYLNSNVILMKSIETIWSLFDQFTSKQFIGMFSQCQLAGASNVLFLDINRMKNDFHNQRQLSTENVCLFSCEYFLDSDHCQSMEKIFFLSEIMDHSLYGIFYKILSQIEINQSMNWNDILSNELKTLNCRNELIDFLLINKRNFYN